MANPLDSFVSRNLSKFGPFKVPPMPKLSGSKAPEFDAKMEQMRREFEQLLERMASQISQAITTTVTTQVTTVVQGEPGPAGEQGPAGPAGPRGAAGTANVVSGLWPLTEGEETGTVDGMACPSVPTVIQCTLLNLVGAASVIGTWTADSFDFQLTGAPLDDAAVLMWTAFL